MTLKEILAVYPQYLLPQHLLSQWMSHLTHCKWVFWKNFMIRQIIKLYGVNMNESLKQELTDFQNFNEFFTRELKHDARPIHQDKNSIVSPADGVISQIGLIDENKVFQAKGHSFTVNELIGGDAHLAHYFENGSFTTIYLSPKDYHRLHMPFTGRLIEMLHIPGKLFSVNTVTTNNVPSLFARNERVIAVFETEIGKMALILVGAIFVSSIETVWHGVVTPPTHTQIQRWQYMDNPVVLNKGDEMGRFNMGSTIIVLFEHNKMQWQEGLMENTALKVGELIGYKSIKETSAKTEGFLNQLFKGLGF